MGFGDVVGPLVSLVKDTFHVSDFVARLVPFTGFLMFFLLSVPMGLVQDRKGKKFVLVLGLAVALAGAVLPILAGMYGRPTDTRGILVSGGKEHSFVSSAETKVSVQPGDKIIFRGLSASKEPFIVPDIPGAPLGPYTFKPATSTITGGEPNVVIHIPRDLSKFYVVLASILLLCAGATILQVCGNPVMRDVSAEGKFSSNLSLAQSVKAVGSSMGFLLLPLVAVPLKLDWSIQFPIFAGALLIALVACMPLQLKTERDPNSRPATMESCFTLFGKNTFILTMVLGIFFYVGAEVCFGSSVPLLLKEKFGLDLQQSLWISWSLVFLPILVGRFAGAAVLRVIKPALFLKLTSILSLAGIALVFSGSQTLTYAGIVLATLGFANIFPLIFSIAVDALPERSNEISGLMISAIVGGAILPPVMGLVVDLCGKNQIAGFAVPFAALLYILWLSLSQAARHSVKA
jgi:fucose permease